jgi:hypothetical protein
MPIEILQQNVMALAKRSASLNLSIRSDKMAVRGMYI